MIPILPDVSINYLPVEEPDAREVIQLIRAESRNGVAIPGNIKSEALCDRLVSEAVRQLDGLDIVVDNAARQISHESIIDITRSSSRRKAFA